MQAISLYCLLYEDGALGKRVLITGASSGIGEQLAYEYARHGASVFITARREERMKQVRGILSEF